MRIKRSTIFMVITAILVVAIAKASGGFSGVINFVKTNLKGGN